MDVEEGEEVEEEARVGGEGEVVVEPLVVVTAVAEVPVVVQDMICSGVKQQALSMWNRTIYRKCRSCGANICTHVSLTSLGSSLPPLLST